MEQYSTPPLNTKSLSLTRFISSDAKAMYTGWANNPRVLKWMFLGDGQDMEQCEDYVNRLIKRYSSDPGNHQWAIRSDNRCIGTIALFVDENNNSGQLAYLLIEEAWGKGYMVQAVRAVINFAFTELGLNRIQADHFSENTSSGRVMQKAGMQREGLQRQKYYKYGTYHDAVLYAALREEWAGDEI